MHHTTKAQIKCTCSINQLSMYVRTDCIRDVKQSYRGNKRKYKIRDYTPNNVFKFNRGIVTNTSKYNLAEGLDLKKPIKVNLSWK